MSLNANKLPNNSKTTIPAMEPGTYPARLVQIITLGVQKQRPFKGQEKPPALSFRLTYEFLDEFLKDEDGNDLEDKPRWLTEELPFLSLKAEKAKSTQRYYALDPDEKFKGDWSQLIGAPCMVTVTNYENSQGDTKDSVASVSAMRPKEAAKAPELKNPSLVFDFEEPDKDVFLNFPDWLQDKIKEAVNFEGSQLQALLVGKERSKKIPAPKPTPQEDVEDTDEEENW